MNYCANFSLMLQPDEATLELEGATAAMLGETVGQYRAEHLVDGVEDRQLCYQSLQYNLRPDNEKTPFANFTMEYMEVARVEILTRKADYGEPFGQLNSSFFEMLPLLVPCSKYEKKPFKV